MGLCGVIYIYELVNINNKEVKVMGKISRMKSGLLNRGHELYKILKGEKAPTWWNSLKALIPIHTDAPEKFAELFSAEWSVILLNDGESVSTL